MKRKTSIAVTIATTLAIPAISFAKRNDETLKASHVPAAVQKAAEHEAKGGKIVRWEKEQGHYEAVIDKGGKQWGVDFNGKGKVLGKHDESSEKGEKEEQEKH